MSLTAIARYTSQSSQSVTTYTELALNIERLQPRTSISLTSAASEVTDRYTFDEPLHDAGRIDLRSRTGDQTRNGAPHTTLTSGYRMGLIAVQTAAGVPAPNVNTTSW